MKYCYAFVMILVGMCWWPVIGTEPNSTIRTASVRTQEKGPSATSSARSRDNRAIAHSRIVNFLKRKGIPGLLLVGSAFTVGVMLTAVTLAGLIYHIQMNRIKKLENRFSMG